MEVWQDKIKGDWCYKFEYEGTVYTEKEFKSQLDARSTGTLKEMQVIMGQEFIPEPPESKEKPLFDNPNNQLSEKPIKKPDNSIEKRLTSEKVPPKITPKVPPKNEPETDNLESNRQKEEPILDEEIKYIPGGAFVIARKLFQSGIWLKPPFYLRVWIWIFGQANHADHKKDNRTYKRGELITTYDQIIKGVAYYYRNALRYPTLKQVRAILAWLKTEGTIEVYAIGQNEGGFVLNRADLGADRKDRPQKREKGQRERAYLGIRIIVINYDTYQTLGNYERADRKDRPQKREKGQTEKHQGFSLIGHNNKNDIRKKTNIYGQNFLIFWKAYPNKVAKKKAHEAWSKLEKAEDMETLLPIILNAIEKQRQAKEIKKAKGGFVSEWPHGATWLNGRRWEDEIDVKQGYDGF